MAGDVSTPNCLHRTMSPNSDFAGFLVRTGSVMSRSSRLSKSSVMALEGDALEDYCKQVFQLCDNDGDGYITESDMAQLCAEDLQTLESVFTYLDKDNDGRVSFDEFLAGFKVYQDTHKGDEEGGRRDSSASPPTPCCDKKRQLEESVYESDPTFLMEGGSWLEVAKRIDPAGLLNKSDVASVWTALEHNDPSLLDNFESFLSEVVEELHQSQSARETMEHHIKKVLDRHHKEASEYDDLVQQHMCEAEESIIMKSAEKSRKLSRRYQSLLAERDALISELSTNQATLKRALEERLESEAVLMQERARLMADNRTLLDKLESSMKQLSEEERGKAPPRGVASLPDIREMDQSDDHHHGDMRGVPECSTPTSVKTFKSNANQGKSCSLHNLYRGDSDGGDGDSVRPPSADDVTQAANCTGSSEPLTHSSGWSCPSTVPTSNDSFVHISSNQCTPSHGAAGSGGRSLLHGKELEVNSKWSTARTSPDGQPVAPTQDTPSCGFMESKVSSYARITRPRHSFANSLMSSGPITYGRTDGGVALVGSGWFTESRQLPKSSGGATRVFKVASLGDSGVGKSTLMTYLSQGEFRHCMATIGVDFITKTMMVGDERVVFQLWDTAGQEKFHAVTMAHYRRADAFIIVYDVTNAKSFKDVTSWVNVIKAAIRDDYPVIMLIGNKCDRVNERVVSKEDGLRMAAGLNAVFSETSAFSGNNVLECHENLARLLLQKEDDAIFSTKNTLARPTPRDKPCAC